MNIVYVGPLPPRPAGSSIWASYVIGGLLDRGHTVTAISQQPPEAITTGAASTGIRHRARLLAFDLPYPDMDTTKPPSESHLGLQSEHICTNLSALLERERPDVVLIGHESYVLGVPSLAEKHGLPCVVQSHAPILSLLEGLYPEPLRGQLAAELARASRIVCCARHMADRVRAAGFHVSSRSRMASI